MSSAKRYPFVKTMKDRAGKVRRYFNRPGYVRYALEGEPGTPEFEANYYAAANQNKPSAIPARPEKAETTFSDLITLYYRSAAFLNLGKTTRSCYRNEIEKIRRDHGHKPLALLDRRGVKAILATKADRPGAANKFLRTMRMLCGFAIEEELRKDDPTARIKKLKVRGGGFPAWEEHHIEAFERVHPEGSRARLALGILLYTAQRRGDAIRIGRKDIRHGHIHLTQSKTATSLAIPIHGDLAAILRTAPVGPTTFLVTSKGEPFTPAGFGNWFGDCCRRAGLPKGFNAHGLRKAAARRLAEAGCSTLQIMSITGHKDIEEVERYTRSVNQARLAAQAIGKI